MENIKMKVCSKCKRELPANSDYYFKKHDTADGYTNKCKECRGYKFTDKLTKIPKDGHKYCIKCNRELPSTNVYFPIDNTCKDGLRNVCRECGKDGHFMEEDYIPKRVWTDAENELFIKRYPYYTNEELIENFYSNETNKTLQNRAYRLGCTNLETEDTKNRRIQSQAEKMSGENSPLWGKPMSLATRKKLSESKKRFHKENPDFFKGRKVSKETRQKLSQWRKERNIWVGKNNPRHKDPLCGERNGRWKGGITSLYRELRSEIREWQKDSMECCNYRCIVTGDCFDHIHHIYPFRKIVTEVFENIKLDERSTTGDYTEKEFENIKKELHKLHNKYGCGACLRKDVHKLYHDLYGYMDNTPEQFQEFIIRFQLGEFDDVLKNCR